MQNYSSGTLAILGNALAPELMCVAKWDGAVWSSPFRGCLRCSTFSFDKTRCNYHRLSFSISKVHCSPMN